MTGSPVTLHGVDVDPPSDLMGRIWARDPGVWGPGEDDPAERLGWLDLPERFGDRLADVQVFAGDSTAQVDTIVLLGMGGSSLAPEVFVATQPGADRAHVVADSTHPQEVRRVRDELDLDRTLFVVSSKSGSTIETMSLFRYYRETAPPQRFVAITDPATSLARLAEESFARTFLNPRDIGGRYSALSYFGLVPPTLAGTDLRGVFDSASEMTRRCSTETAPAENPALVLGSALARLASDGRDKLTFVVSEPIAAFGDWVEQLLAESTGKNGTGIAPIVHEPAVGPVDYGSDRAFAVLRLRADDEVSARAAALIGSGQPVVEIELTDERDLGAQMFLWELATAVAGSLMDINPFDQPDVEAAKQASRSALEDRAPAPWPRDDPARLFDGIVPGDLAVICAFAPRSSASTDVLTAARARLLREHGVATMAGFGPRYLHSTGQLHKGGSPRLRALVVLDEPGDDEPIPDAPYGFKDLVTAQAAGDARALEAAGRPVGRTSWEQFEAWAAGEG